MRKEDYFFDCACHRNTHLLRFYLNHDDKDFPPELYAIILLNKKSFFKRLYIGIKYILGAQSEYGYFEEWIFDYNYIKEFKSMINDFEKYNNEWVQSLEITE